jgi:hypothetical protein
MADPSRGDDGAVHPLAAVGFGIATVAVFTATAFALITAFTEEETPPPEATIDSEVHPADRRGAWIELWLVETPLETIPASDLTVRTEAPGGATSTAVCGEPGLRAGEGACQKPFVDNAWGRGDGLWVPCRADGLHVLTVTVQGTVVAELAEECKRPAPSLSASAE